MYRRFYIWMMIVMVTWMKLSYCDVYFGGFTFCQLHSANLVPFQDAIIIGVICMHHHKRQCWGPVLNVTVLIGVCNPKIDLWNLFTCVRQSFSTFEYEHLTGNLPIPDISINITVTPLCHYGYMELCNSSTCSRIFFSIFEYCSLWVTPPVPEQLFEVICKTSPSLWLSWNPVIPPNVPQWQSHWPIPMWPWLLNRT